MNLGQFVSSVLLTGAIVVLVTTPTRSEEILSIKLKKSKIATQQAPLVNNSQLVEPIREIRRLGEIERPLHSAQMLVQSPTPSSVPVIEVVQVTGVKANPTQRGVEVILQTSKGQQLQVTNQSSGNSFIADIKNAQLRLPSGDAFTFRSQKPIAGITEITVTNFDANTIRVTVTGEAGVPTVELYDSPDEGLIFSVASTAPSVQQQQQTPQKPEQDLPLNQTQPQKPSAQDDQPIELVVTGELDGYSVPDASTATRTDTPIRDIPQSIQVVPQQVIRDQQGLGLEDIIRNVSGVRPAVNNTNVANQGAVNVRGFSQNTLFRNGFPTRSNSLIDVAGVERIEVLKGPASVLYGQSEPGGIINIVTKKPLENPFYSADLQIGSYGLYRPSLDISGPLTADKNILYRLNVAYTNSGSFRDFVSSERFYVAPALTFKLSNNTSVTFDLEYLYDDRTFDNTIPVIGDRPGKLPIDRFLGEPDDLKGTEDIFTGYLLEHKFSENWQLRNAFRYHFNQSDRSVFRAGSLSRNNRELNRDYQDFTIETEEFNLITDVVGKFSTGSVKHTLLAGLDLRRQKFNNQGITSRANFPIDVFNPIYGTPIPTTNFRITDIQEATEWAGFYVQDQISLLDNLILVLGGRFDFVNNLLNGSNNDFQDFAFSPRVGIVYRPLQPVSLYASYSKAFNPQSGFTADFSALEPTTGEQFEVGVKTEFFGGKLASTLAFYEITKQNIKNSVPGTDFSILTGEQRSRGIELDVTGEIAPGFNLIASYAYTDARITRDDTGLQGLRPYNAPEHTGSLWLTYELQSSALKGLGLGAGVFFASRNEGRDGTYYLPGFTTVDLATWYRFSLGRSNARVQLNIKNLFDTEYYEATSGRTINQPGAPLTVIGRFSVEF